MSHVIKRRKVDFNEVISRGFLTETNVGITEFIGEQKPFIGILKHRFEDFIVHEIDKQNSVVTLQNIDQPEDIGENEEKEEIVQLSEIKIDQKIVDDIQNYITNLNSSPVMISIENLDKNERTKIHNYIRQNFPQLESKTENIDGKKFIKVINERNDARSNDKFRNNNQKSQKRLRWPKDRPNYVHFVLYKENMETIQVVNELSRRLACTPKNFSFAGNKDKRAITTQMFCAWKTNPNQIWKVVKEFNRRSRFNIKIHVGHFKHHSEPLKLGDLNGNFFEIILRNVRLVDDLNKTESIDVNLMKSNSDESLKTVKSIGFINYFGMQRFGSHRIDSHKLGILILKKNFKQLVNEILTEKPIDLRPYNNSREVSFNEAIRIWRETGDAGLAYKKMNYKYTIEGSLLRALTRVPPNDYHGALCVGLLRNSRLLYLHAYQSYLWNRIASFRLREFGLNVIEGDLVFVGPKFVDGLAGDDEVIESSDKIDDEHSPKNEATESENNDNDNAKIKANIPSDQIIYITKENINQFTIYDVVLPIIGGLSKLPKNKTAEFIESILKEDDVSIEDFAALSKQWCVNGSYRKLIVRPSTLEWQWLDYSDDNKPLILNDLDKLRAQKTTETDKNSTETKPTELKSETVPLKIALKISVTLPTSSYATVFLREVTKISSLSLENKPWQNSESIIKEEETATDSNEHH